MVILAVETATRTGSLGLWDHGQLHGSAAPSTRTHAERLPAEAIDWLGVHGRVIADVDLFAVVSGPGSFTGLRVGIAAVQGLALAGHRRAIGIPTLEALATAYLLSPEGEIPPSGEARWIVACADAQRGEVFFAAYAAHNRDGVDERHERLAPAVASPGELASAVSRAAGASPVIFVGDGAVRYEPVLRDAVPQAVVYHSPVPLAQAAAWLAHARQHQAGAPHALRPIYIRRPDVELARERSAPREASDLSRFRIEKGHAGDIAAVDELQRHAFTNPWGADAMRWELEHTDVARLYVIRAPSSRLVGYCACWIVFDELHINSLAIDPDWRRRGLARHLLRRVFAEARSAGAATATLEVRESNVGARRLYEGLGFRVEAVRRDYYQGPREDALILWHRDLGAFATPGQGH